LKYEEFLLVVISDEAFLLAAPWLLVRRLSTSDIKGALGVARL
jgi:hypothetical protein